MATLEALVNALEARTPTSAATPPGGGSLGQRRCPDGVQRRERGSDPHRGPAARHRQDRHPRGDPEQAGAAHRHRVRARQATRAGGLQILAPLVHLKDVITFVRSHHERWDGCGYPTAWPARPSSSARASSGRWRSTDALTTSRPYQEKMPPEIAVERMRDLVGSMLDPAVHDALGHRDRPSPGARLPRRRSRLSVPVPAAQGRILLVDDDPMIVRLVKKILAAKGLGEVVHAASGREALERLDDTGSPSSSSTTSCPTVPASTSWTPSGRGRTRRRS